MANTKVRVLYPTAFMASGVEVYKQTKDKQGRVTAETPIEEVDIDSGLADALISQGYAEVVKKGKD
jgi:hypothetical protein